jgi:HPt (histidine-containing phosphotransfer) domain-containing protein
MPDEPILDLKTIEMLRSYETDGLITLAELFETFLVDMATRTASIADALERSDTKKLEQAAHALKSAAGNVGALRMREICQQLEDLGKSRSLTGARELFEELNNEIPRVEQALKSLTSS